MHLHFTFFQRKHIKYEKKNIFSSSQNYIFTRDLKLYYRRALKKLVLLALDPLPNNTDEEYFCFYTYKNAYPFV